MPARAAEQPALILTWRVASHVIRGRPVVDLDSSIMPLAVFLFVFFSAVYDVNVKASPLANA